MQLRDYQQDLLQRTKNALKTNKSVLFQLPTGGGKTAVLTELVCDAVANGLRVNVIVHRDELVSQVAASLVRRGLQPFVVNAKASRYVPHDARVFVSMVQTLAKRSVIPVDLIVIDEAHHAVSPTYQNIIDATKPKYLVGCTATPERLDGKGLHDVFDELVQGLSPHELIEQGWLVPSDIYACPLAYEPKEKSCGDFTNAASRDVMQASVLHGDVIASWQAYATNKQTIAYAVSVDLAEQYASEYQAAGVVAECVSARTDKRTRGNIVNRFRSGQSRVLINVAIVTEGFDVPACECVQMLRPTASLALYLQMVGRVLRPAKNKTKAIILDHAGNVLRLGYPEQPRRWSLDGSRARAQSELPPLFDVEGLPEMDGEGTRAIQHNRFVRLVPTRLAVTNVLPARLRHLVGLAVERLGDVAGAVYGWREWLREGGQPTVAIAEEYARQHGLSDDWGAHQMVGYKFSRTHIHNS